MLTSVATPVNLSSASSIPLTTDSGAAPPLDNTPRPLASAPPAPHAIDESPPADLHESKEIASDHNEGEAKEPKDPRKKMAEIAKNASEEEARELAKQKIAPITTPYRTAADIKFQADCNWILNADSDGNFIDWAQAEVERKHREPEAKALQWIYSPNATDDQKLELAINSKPRDTSGRHKAQLVAKTVLSFGLMHINSSKIIQPGTLWTTKQYKGRQEIRFVSSDGAPEIQTLAAFQHNYVKMFQLNDPFIQDGNITIVTIQPGYIGIAMVKNIPIILLPGRHAYNTPDFSMDVKNRLNVRDSMSTILKQFPTLTITRVLPGEIAIADDNGNPKILLPGTYIRNSTTFQFIIKLDALTLKPIHSDEDKRSELRGEVKGDSQVTGSFYKYKSLTLVNVALNQYGCAITNEGYKLLDSGIHLFNDSSFRFVKFEDRTSPDINHGPMRIVRVEPGSLGLATNITLNRAIILHSGTYTFTGFDRQFKEFKELSKDIKHLNYTRVVVKDGFVGTADRGGRCELLDPGIYEEYDPLFTFKEQKDLAKAEVVQYGNEADVIVKSGTARAVYVNGDLEVLTESKKFRNAKTLYILDFVMSSKKQIHDLKPETVQTKDNLPYEVIPQVMFAIENFKQLILSLGEDVARNPKAHIEQRLIAIIRDQFMRYDSTVINPTKHAAALGEKKGEASEDKRLGITVQEEGKQSRTTLEHDVREAIKNDLKPCGIEIFEFEFLGFQFKDADMQKLAAQNTAKLRDQEMKLRFTTAEAAVKYTEAQATATRELLQKQSAAQTGLEEAKLLAQRQTLETTQLAKSAAEKRKIEADIQNEINLAQTRAAAEALKIKTDSDAYANVAKARAEAQATIATAEAKAKGIALELAAEAEGNKQKNEAELIKFNCPGYVQLEIAKAKIAMAAQLSRAQAPMINVQGGSNSGVTDIAKQMLGGRSAEGLIKALLHREGMFRPMSRSASDPDLSFSLSREPAESKLKTVTTKEPGNPEIAPSKKVAHDVKRASSNLGSRDAAEAKIEVKENTDQSRTLKP